MEVFAIGVFSSLVANAIFTLICEAYKAVNKPSDSYPDEGDLQCDFASELMRAARNLSTNSQTVDSIRKAIAESNSLQFYITESIRYCAIDGGKSERYKKMALNELSEIVGRFISDTEEFDRDFAEYFQIALSYYRKQNFHEIVVEGLGKINSILDEWKENFDYEKQLELIPYVLIGTWHNANEVELDLFPKYFDVDYPCKLPTMLRVSGKEVFELRNDEWSIVAREQYVPEVSLMMTRKYLQNYERMLIDVLGKIDPVYQGAEEERKAARFVEVNKSMTSSVKKELTLGLLFLKNNGLENSTCLLGMFSNWEEFTESIVAQLLRSTDWEQWASLDSLLPILAEISPDVFLRCLRKSAEESTTGCLVLFNQENSFMGSNSHTYLLWALEVLLWKKDNFIDSVLLAAEIADNISNERRISGIIDMLHNSLRPFQSQTFASITQRRRASSILIQKYPVIGTKVLVSMMPSRGRRILGSNYKPRELSDYILSQNDRISDSTYWEYIDHLVDCLIGRPMPYAISMLIPKIENLVLPDIRDKVLEAISKMPPSIDEKEGSPCWEALKSTIHWQYKLREKQENYFSDDLLSFMEEQTERLTPLDLVRKFAWLFCYHPKPPYKTDEIVTGNDLRVIEDRKQALKAILLQEDWFELLLRLIEASDQSFIIADSLSTIEMSEKYESIASMPLLSSLKRELFFRIFAHSCLLLETGFERYFERVISQYQSDKDATRFALYLLAVEPTIDLWTRIEKLDLNVENEYWKRYEVFRLEVADRKLIFALDKFIQVGRVSSTIEMLSHTLHYSKDEGLPEGIEDILNSLLHFMDENTVNKQLIPFGYETKDMLERLDSRGLDEELLFKLEMKFFPHIVKRGYQFPATTNLLVSEPSEYVKLIEWHYKGRNEEKSEPAARDASQKASAQFAFWFLREWQGKPGYSEENGLDLDKFRFWVNEVIEQSEAKGRGKIVLYEIARIFFRIPSLDDSLHLNPGVMDLLGEINSPTLDEAVMIEFINGRGIVTKGSGEGGLQERDLAARFADQAAIVEGSYPNTAAILRRLSKRYLSKAIKEDREVEQYKS